MAYCGHLKTPSGLFVAMPWSTENRAKKIGACSRIGRQEDSGLVPVSRYSFIISCDCRSRSPAYFFWISFICGWMICRLRCALICLTNSGISSDPDDDDQADDRQRPGDAGVRAHERRQQRVELHEDPGDGDAQPVEDEHSGSLDRGGRRRRRRGDRARDGWCAQGTSSHPCRSAASPRARCARVVVPSGWIAGPPASPVGTGSSPPLLHGLHRSSRHDASAEPLDRTVGLQRPDRVARAGRVVLAGGAEQGGQRQLVEPDGQHQQRRQQPPEAPYPQDIPRISPEISHRRTGHRFATSSP